MEVVIIDEMQRLLWEDFVHENRHSIAWHSYEWREVLQRHYKFIFYPFAVIDSDKIVCILPLYYMKTTMGMHSLISVPYVVAGGILSDFEEVREALLKKAVDISKKHGLCGIVLKQYKVKMKGDLLTDDNYFNRELSLTQDLNQTIGQFSEINRQMIEETEKDRFVLEYPNNDIFPFYKLLSHHSHRKGIPCVRRGWIDDLLRFKMYSIALLKRGNEIVAGTMIKEFKKTVSFPFTCIKGTSEAESRYAYCLYWKLIQYFSKKGSEIFHSGRIPANEATDPYRLGWGGNKHTYFYQYYPNINMNTEYSIKKGRKRILFEKCWKLLPFGIAEKVGPAIVKQFP